MATFNHQIQGEYLVPIRRTAGACQRCRRRKIRCSLDTSQGYRCSNCAHSHQDCVFIPPSQAFVPAHAGQPHLQQGTGRGALRLGEDVMLHDAQSHLSPNQHPIAPPGSDQQPQEAYGMLPLDERGVPLAPANDPLPNAPGQPFLSSLQTDRRLSSHSSYSGFEQSPTTATNCALPPTHTFPGLHRPPGVRSSQPTTFSSESVSIPPPGQKRPARDMLGPSTVRRRSSTDSNMLSALGPGNQIGHSRSHEVHHQWTRG